MESLGGLPGGGYCRFRSVSLAILAAAVVGCASPAPSGRCHVAADLRCRAGHPLGPVTSSCAVAIPDFVDLQDALSEDEAVALGLWNNASFQELLVDLGIAQADLIEAHQLANPEISTMFPLGPKQWELALLVPLDVLCLRPWRVAAAQLESKRVAERLVQDGLNVVRDVRLACADAVLAQERLLLAEEGARLRRRIADMAAARVRAGAESALDVAPIRIDSLLGEAELVRAAHDVDLAYQRLRLAMGIGTTDIPAVPLIPSRIPHDELNVDELVSAALAARPDARAARLAIVAACQRAKLARRDYFNIGGILPDLNSRGKKGFEAGPGLRLIIPIFHQNQAAIARADAEVERRRRQVASLQDQIALEVGQAYTRLVQAREDLARLHEQIVPEADVALTRVRRALQQDGASLLLVLETTRQLLTALEREAVVAADVRRAVAELERSVGRRLFDRPMTDPDDAENLPVVAPEPGRDVEEIPP